MRFADSIAAAAALTLIASLGACDKKETTDPDSGSNLLGTPTSSSSSSSDDEVASLGGGGELQDDGKEVEVEPRKELPPPAKASKKCKKVREGKKRVTKCRMVDPKPKLSASHGVYTLMGDFRWRMTPTQVFKLLSRDVEAEYAKRQESTKDPTQQDANRRWRAEQLEAIKANHVKFTTASKHRWGVSLIQFEYEDDNEEEMLWARTGNGLRKFYFFKDDELWKIVYAYSTDVWPGKTYEDIVDEKFHKWFGPSPEQKVKQDPETGAPVLRYNEWTALDGEIVRSFDMTELHGVIMLAVVDGQTEKIMGERLPNMKRDDSFTGAVEDVLGGTDVCYDDDGNIRECTEEEAMGLDE